MKPIYVVLIAIATALVGGGIGLIGGVGGAAGGASIGICITTETAKEQGLLTPEQADERLGTIRQKAETEFQLQSGELQSFNCDEINRDLPFQ